jgi:hypothetical protein
LKHACVVPLNHFPAGGRVFISEWGGGSYSYTWLVEWCSSGKGAWILVWSVCIAIGERDFHQARDDCDRPGSRRRPDGGVRRFQGEASRARQIQPCRRML